LPPATLKGGSFSCRVLPPCPPKGGFVLLSCFDPCSSKGGLFHCRVLPPCPPKGGGRPLVVFCPPCPPKGGFVLLLIVRLFLSFVFCLLSFVFCLLSFVFCLLSFVFCLLFIPHTSHLTPFKAAYFHASSPAPSPTYYSKHSKQTESFSVSPPDQ